MSWNPIPVSAHALHRRAVLHGETLIRDVSFLPFFNREGRVKRVVTVVPGRAVIGVLPREVVLPRISLLGRIRVPPNVPLFYPIRRSEPRELCSLWHFDLWWLLDEECCSNHWDRLPLRATNCVSRTTHRLLSVIYRGDLSAATTILLQPPGKRVRNCPLETPLSSATAAAEGPEKLRVSSKPLDPRPHLDPPSMSGVASIQNLPGCANQPCQGEWLASLIRLPLMAQV